MRKYLLLTLYIFLCSFLSAQTIKLHENFEQGLPSSAPSSETVASLSSGDWLIKGVSGYKDNGSNRLRMNANGYAITPAIDKAVSVTFTHRGSGSGKVVTVAKSIDNGANWEVIGSATVNSSSTYGTSTFAIQEAGTTGVKLRFLCNSSTIYIDDVEVTASDMGDEPTVQASLSASEISGSSVKITFEKGNGNGRLLLYAQHAFSSWKPEDGELYKNLPKEIEDNVTLVYAGNEDEVVVTGLVSGETYYFSVYEYLSTNNLPNYLTTTAGQLQVKTLEIPSILARPAAINFGAVKVGDFSKRSFDVSAKYLSGQGSSIQLTAPTGFLISTTSLDGYTNSLNLPIVANAVANTTIYVMFSPTDYQHYQADIQIQGGGATAVCTLTGLGSDTDAKVYFIAPDGNDSNDGSYDAPWYNLQKAVNTMQPGDTVLCRGGVYYPNMKQDGTKTTVRLNAKGTSDKWYTIKNYPGEFPIFNFKDQPKKVSVRGVQLNGDYWHLYGLHITEAGDNGLKIEGNHNRIERCTFSYNDDTGLQLGFGHDFSATGFGSSNDGSYCAYNDVVDCDSYLNCDSDNYGSDADGFACKMHNGIGNRFIRCRAWDNADDAWDMYETDYAVYLIECWAWGSGRASNFGWVQASGSFQGNGNGIKLGGNGTGGSSKGVHEAWNCIAFNNNKTGSVKGFDQNSHAGGEKIINCLAFGNGYDFMFERSAANREYYNNVCFGKIEIAAGSNESNNAMLSTSNKAWNNNVFRNFSAADYVSLTEEDAKAPRGEDGSLPKKFGRLKSNSALIDQGLSFTMPFTNEFPFVLQPVFGAARDLGPYEYYDDNMSSSPQIIINHQAQLNLNVSPNPCRTEAILKISSEHADFATITLHHLDGRVCKQAYSNPIDAGIEYYIPLQVGDLEMGTYLVRLQVGNQSQSAKLLIIR